MIPDSINLSWDKIVLFLSGLFFAFIWPQLIARQVRSAGLSGRVLANLMWFRAFGILLMVLALIMAMIGW